MLKQNSTNAQAYHRIFCPCTQSMDVDVPVRYVREVHVNTKSNELAII